MAMRDLEFVEQHKITTELKLDCTVHTIFEANPNPRLRRIERKETWSRVKELGQGGFGIVYLEQEAQGSLRAVKRVRKSEVRQDDHDSLRELFSISIFSKNTANFPAFFGWFDDVSHIYIAMEYFPLGDLRQCISGLDRLVSEHEAKIICFQMAMALEAIHERSITHRDLKSNNVFVVEKEPNWHVKLGDFGISKHVRNQATAMHTVFLGPFVAPEVRKLVDADEGDEFHYTSAVDIWSLGSLAYWLVTKTNPFPGRSGQSYLRTGQIPDEMIKSLNISREGLEFIKQCLELDPDNRPSARETFEHSWLRDTQLALPAVAVTIQDSQTSSGTVKRKRSPSVVATAEHTVKRPTSPLSQPPTTPAVNRNLAPGPNSSAQPFSSKAPIVRYRSTFKDSDIVETLFTHPARLFVKDMNDVENRRWTLWAAGQVKIVKIQVPSWISLNWRRIFMRDTATGKVAINHYADRGIMKSTVLDHAWTWKAHRDMDDLSAPPTHLAVAFSDHGSSQRFWKAYDEAQRANMKL